MFALFFSLYISMFMGSWTLYDLNSINNAMVYKWNAIGKLVTSVFGDNTFDTLGNDLSGTDLLSVAAYILALITSIGIVVMAVKGVKKAFGIFFMIYR